jgi:hypothetical protein
MLFRKIDSSSANTVTSALGFFETPPSNVGISSSVFKELLTLNPITDPPYIFKLHPGSSFLDLSNVYLETEFQIQKRQGNDWMPIETADDVGVIQAPGATWIRNLKVNINGRETYNSNQLYAYKSYIDLELSYNREVKSSYLAVCGYMPSAADTTNVDSHDDEGYVARKKLFAGGKRVQFYTKLNADIFASDLFMLNNIAIEIEIYPNTSEFMLLDYRGAPKPGEAARPAYRFTLTGLKMFCKYVELMEGISMDIASRLEKTPARYGIRRSEMRSAVITEGRWEFQTNLFTDQLPRRIIIALVEPSAYNGALAKSPFKLTHGNCREISIISGGLTWPAVLYNMDWSDNRNTYMRCYADFMAGIGLANSLETNGISPANYKNGWTFYLFNLTSDLENSAAFELVKAGTSSVMIRFNKAVPKGGLHLIAYSEYDSLLMIDSTRSIQTDMTA